MPKFDINEISLKNTTRFTIVPAMPFCTRDGVIVINYMRLPKKKTKIKRI